MAVLKLVKGGTVGQVLPLSGDRNVLGRHPSCQIVLDNAAVSRHHAQILENHGTYFLEDLRSRNGTLVNQTPVRGRLELRDGDEIQVCDYTFHFFTTSALNAAAPVEVPATRPPGRRPAQRAETVLDEEDEQPPTAPEGDETPDPRLEGSSIISSVEAGSVHTVRLNVRPEVKLRAILEITSALGRVLKVGDVLPLILESLFKIFPQSDWGFVLLKDAGTGKLKVQASRSRRSDDEADVPLSMTIVRQAMETRKAMLSADALRDRRFAASESLADLQIRSVMCAPLVNQAGEAIGVIQMSTQDLGQQFTSDDLELLASVSIQCALAVENATLHEAAIAQRDLERELEFATQVQLGFLPTDKPRIAGYEFADYYEPAHRVGGDYFDYIRLPNGYVAVTLGDVAGKGVPAALLMARLHASARYHLLSATSASEALASLNAEIMTSGLGFRFITLALAVIDPRRHELRLANAGHLPPLLRNARGVVGPIGQKESGMPLGILANQSFQEVVVPLDVGDTLLFYTDGVTEAMNAAQEIYGRHRLTDVFSHGPAAVEELVPAIVEDVEKFYGARAQRDDLCIVAVRRCE